MDKTLEKLFAELRSKSLRDANKAEKRIRASYKALLKELQGFAAEEYARLSKEGKLTYSILQQKGEYARFLEECTKRLDGISPKITEEIQKTVNETYELNYTGMVDAVSNAKDYKSLQEELKGVKATTPSVIKKAVENPIQKLTLKDTLEHKRNEIKYNIRKQVSIGLSQGDRYETMAKRIADSLDGDYKKAIRIVRTEAHKVREQGLNDAAVNCNDAISKGESGLIMVKIWRTGRDKRVRDTHSAMEGVVALMDEHFELPSGATTLTPGDSGVASEDINCRCYLSYKLMTVEEYEKASGKTYEGKKSANEVEDDINFDEMSVNQLTKSQVEQLINDNYDKFNRELVDVFEDDNPLGNMNIGELRSLMQANRDYGGYDWDEDEFDSLLGEFLGKPKNTEVTYKIYEKDDLVREYKRMGVTSEESDILYGTPSTYKGIPFSELPDEMFDKINWDEMPSGYIFSEGSYEINGKLRMGKSLTKGEKITSDTLSSIINRNELVDDISVIRGAGKDYVKSVFGDTDELMAVVTRGNREEIEDYIGTVVTEKAFVSTSASRSATHEAFRRSNSPVVLNLKAKKGTHAFVTDNYKEAEIIFDKGTRYKITNLSIGDNNQLIIDAEILK